MKTSVRRQLTIIALVLGISLSMGLGGPAAAEDKEPILIAGSLPLTGKFAETAKWIERGMKFWAEEVNKQGGLLGRPVKFKIYDDESNANKAVIAAEKAITVDNCDLLFGGYPGTAARAVMPVAEKHKMVYVSMGGHMKSFKQGYTYCFGGPPLMGEWWYVGFMQWLGTLPPEKRPKKAAFYAMNNPIGASLHAAKKDLKELGIEVAVDEKYNLPLPDATPLIVKAKQANCDILFSNGFFADGVMTIRAAKALDYNPKAIVQGIGSVIPAWTKELGEDGNYVFSGTSL